MQARFSYHETENLFSLYTTSSFVRLKLGHVLADRDVAPHIHESHQEATAWLRHARTGDRSHAGVRDAR
jgi:hypothetical protein